MASAASVESAATAMEACAAVEAGAAVEAAIKSSMDSWCACDGPMSHCAWSEACRRAPHESWTSHEPRPSDESRVSDDSRTMEPRTKCVHKMRSEEEPCTVYDYR